MLEIWANFLLPKALKRGPKSNKSPNLVTLVSNYLSKQTYSNFTPFEACKKVIYYWSQIEQTKKNSYARQYGAIPAESSYNSRSNSRATGHYGSLYPGAPNYRSQSEPRGKENTFFCLTFWEYTLYHCFGLLKNWHWQSLDHLMCRAIRPRNQAPVVKHHLTIWLSHLARLVSF